MSSAFICFGSESNTFCDLLIWFVPEESKPDPDGTIRNDTLKSLLEKARDVSPENQQNIKIAFAEGYLAANTDHKENPSGAGKAMKV